MESPIRSQGSSYWRQWVLEDSETTHPQAVVFSWQMDGTERFAVSLRWSERNSSAELVERDGGKNGPKKG